jgi:hypothetical protein
VVECVSTATILKSGILAFSTNFFTDPIKLTVADWNGLVLENAFYQKYLSSGV